MWHRISLCFIHQRNIRGATLDRYLTLPCTSKWRDLGSQNKGVERGKSRSSHWNGLYLLGLAAWLSTSTLVHHPRVYSFI